MKWHVVLEQNPTIQRWKLFTRRLLIQWIKLSRAIVQMTAELQADSRSLYETDYVRWVEATMGIL
jgi:hypothetical protein